MTVLQIQTFLDESLPVKPGFTIAVTLFNTSSYYVFFDLFGDSSDLNKVNKWRFIPIDKAVNYYRELKKTRIQNSDYSIIVEGDNISKLELAKMNYSGIEI